MFVTQRIVFATLLAAAGCLASHALADEPPAMSDPALPADGGYTEGYADHDGVKIHYVEVGEGPLVVMIHGFPDFWYSFRHQMDALKDAYRVVAIDQRGYNLSDAPDPANLENYDMRLLVGDVVAVIRALGEEKATILGHDWGGVVAWNVAFHVPQVVDKLVIFNLPHPNGMARAWRDNPQALAQTEYARTFREGTPADPDVFFGFPMTAQTLAGWVTDPEAREKYVSAFGRSNFDAMLAYYKRNYPDLWSEDSADASGWLDSPNIAVSTLVVHGLEDTALHSDGLNGTWNWIDADLTILTIPKAGHFVQQDAAETVSKNLRAWLDLRR